MRKTTIIATLGPASSESGIIREMIEAGVDIFRLNFSHGTHAQHNELIDKIRSASADAGKLAGILGDLSGPKIRIGGFAKGSVFLEPEAVFDIYGNSDFPGDQNKCATAYPYLTKDLSPGDIILLDDGNIKLKAISRTEEYVRFIVLDGGRLSDHKGMNFPGIHLTVESLTEKDLRDLDFILNHDFDFAALSFVRSANCIRTLKKHTSGSGLSLIAKIEKPEAVKDIDAIINESNGIMIARGDLGVEMNIEQVPSVQKSIIQHCAMSGTPVITATQMLESMITNSRPTRAEAGDVYNAVMDGTDAVMLSGETAIGANPVEAVRTMARIAEEGEHTVESQHRIRGKKNVAFSIPETAAHTACQSALDLKASAIVVYTMSGDSAARIAAYHPPVPVVALCTSEKVCRRLLLHYGIIARKIGDMKNTDHMFEVAEKEVTTLGTATKGATVIIVAGIPLHCKGNTNLIKIHTL